MKLAGSLAVASVFCLLNGSAEASFAGKYTFNWLKSPGKQRCLKIDSKLDAEMSSRRFKCERGGRTEAGQTPMACKRLAGGVEYLVFETRAACENERKAQDANSEE